MNIQNTLDMVTSEYTNLCKKSISISRIILKIKNKEYYILNQLNALKKNRDYDIQAVNQKVIGFLGLSLAREMRTI
jgi:hypothetical protein